MIRIFFYFCFLGSLIALPGCKALEPIEQNFFLGKFINENEALVEEVRTYPLLIFRTPGYEFTQNDRQFLSLMAIFTFLMWVRWRSSIFLRGPIILKSGPRRGT